MLAACGYEQPSPDPRATDFDELDASDSDAEESDDDILGAGATYDPADMQRQQDNVDEAVDDLQA